MKAWEIYQNLAKGMGESAWKIRSVCFSLTAALVAYSYSSGLPDLYLVASTLAILFYLMESGYRRLQYQYIRKSISIEQTLNDIIAGDPTPRFPDSIGTDVDTPSIQQLFELFALKRFMVWLPYLLIFTAPILLFCFQVQRPS
jgi:hypothetical protein